MRVHDTRPPLFALFLSLPPPFPSARRTKAAGQGKLHPIYRYSSPLIRLLPFSSFSLSSNFFSTSFFLLSCILSHLLHFSFPSTEKRSFVNDLFHFHCFFFNYFSFFLIYYTREVIRKMENFSSLCEFSLSNLFSK